MTDPKELHKDLKFEIVRAKYIEHNNIVQSVSRFSKYTKDFTNHMFSGEAMYDKGWITVVKNLSDGTIIAFMCVRHKVREPVTTLYFIGVDPLYKGLGLGKKLIEHLKEDSPHNCIHLNVMSDNLPALGFYQGLGFKEVGTALKGKGVALELKF